MQGNDAELKRRLVPAIFAACFYRYWGWNVQRLSVIARKSYLLDGRFDDTASKLW